MEEDIRRWLILSGFTGSSLEKVERYIPRWKRRLGDMGVTEVMPPMISRNAADDRVNSLLCLWVKQAMAKEDRDPTAEHELRNLIDTRPWKV